MKFISKFLTISQLTLLLLFISQSVFCMETKDETEKKADGKDIEWDNTVLDTGTKGVISNLFNRSEIKTKIYKEEVKSKTSKELDTEIKTLKAEEKKLLNKGYALKNNLQTLSKEEEILRCKKDIMENNERSKKTVEKLFAVEDEILSREKKTEPDTSKILLTYNLEERFPQLSQKTNTRTLCDALLTEFTKYAFQEEDLLTSCLCSKAPPASRILLILQQLNSIVQKYDPNKLFVHAELGEAGFLQLYLLAYGLLYIGYKNIRLIPVNRDHGKPEVKNRYLAKAAFTKKELSETFKSTTVTVSTEFFGKTSDTNLQTLSSLIKGKKPRIL